MFSSARSAVWSSARVVANFDRSAVAPGLRKNVPRAIRGQPGVRFGQMTRWQSTVSEATRSTPRAETLPKKPLYIRIPGVIALSLLTFTLGFTMAAAPAAPALKEFITPPSDEETMSLYTPSTDQAAAIEKAISEHPITQSLMADKSFIPARPHLKIPPAVRAQSLTGGTLLGDEKIVVPPLQFTTADGSRYVSIQYIGTALCGHPGIIHGGLLATLLDEGLARCCFPALPNRAAVTASLKVDYKAPAMAGQILVLRAETTRVEGRKAWVKGRLETTEGVVVTEAEALYIEPKMAAQMNLVKA